ncbi:MAG: MOSC domain-containing protein YiiM [Gammaproteobacteria bacterium]|jgi:MOSC domain-containing protein YiiM
MQTLCELLETMPQIGRVQWIGLRPARNEAITSVEWVFADPNRGLEGDRYSGRSGKRHVSLIQAEHLPVVASCLGRESVEPHLVRRNIVVSGINLLALKGSVVSIGEVKLEITGACHPCSRMEHALGVGGYNAMRGHGGMTARILTGGTIALDAPVCFCARA